MQLLEIVALIAAFIVGYLVGKGRVQVVLGSMRPLGAGTPVTVTVANNSDSKDTTATVTRIPQSNEPGSSTVVFDGTVEKGGTKKVSFSIPKGENTMVKLNAGLGLGVTFTVQLGTTKKTYKLSAAASKSFVISTTSAGSLSSWSA